MIRGIERYFELERLGTTVRTELLAGATTFLTMAYILVVNPSILADAGMEPEAVTAATCVAAGLGSLAMGLWARHPIALAPGMGINAYFTYAVVIGMGVPWETALGAVFLSGVIFGVLTISGIRQRVVAAAPRELYAAVAAGIGLFLAFIGLKNAGIVRADPSTFVGLGDLSQPEALLACGGLALIGILMAYRVRAAVLLGIVAATTVAILTGMAEWRPGRLDFSAMTAAAFKLDVGAALSLGLADIVFVFLFVDFFDTLGTLIAVTKRAGLMDANGKIPRLGRMLAVDASATALGAVAGTSTTTSYVESAAGVAAGGRSGLTAVTVGVLFLLALPLAPLAGMIPAAATAPALILVGSMMMGAVREIDWEDVTTSAPAFLIILGIPLTFSISNGLALGFLLWVVLKTATGERLAWLSYVLAALFLARFAYLAG
ncbi:MAG: NCS2 family permease [Bryobacterales bacterium]|nr:NCS2 family permease [Bryobacterales bacterium]